MSRENKRKNNSSNFFSLTEHSSNFPPGIFSLQAKTFAGDLPFVSPPPSLLSRE